MRQIRTDLVQAAEMKQSAAAQIEEIDRKMKALPAELEALRAQGAQEIAAEEERIRAAAAAERDRLLEQARRDIDLQVKIAERELVEPRRRRSPSASRPSASRRTSPTTIRSAWSIGTWSSCREAHDEQDCGHRYARALLDVAVKEKVDLEHVQTRARGLRAISSSIIRRSRRSC